MVSTDLQHFNNFKQFHVELIEQQCFDFIFCIETGLKAERKTLYLKLNVSLWTYFFRFVTVTIIRMHGAMKITIVGRSKERITHMYIF